MVTAARWSRTTPLLSAPVALGVLLVVLITTNVARTAVVPGHWHLVFNISIGVGAAAVAVAAGLSAADLGGARADLGAGLRLGGLASLAITVVVLAGGAAGLFADGRVDVSLGEMLLRALVVIPVGTVLVEELVFRGVLHGLLVQVTSARGALVAGALLFGLWHVFPAWRGGAVDTDLADVGRVATATATFIATAVAGSAFLWLRVRSKSLVTPILAHLATNSVTFAVAWAVR